jgi:uncharacterized membrane protein
MRWLIHRFFGLGSEYGADSQAQPTLLGLWEWTWLLALLGLLVVWFVWSMYKADGRSLSPGRRRVLWALRLSVALTVLLMLLKPALKITKGEDQLPVAAVLLDESLSMVLPDSRDDVLIKGAVTQQERSRMAAARKALDVVLESGLAKTHRVKIFSFSDLVKPIREITWKGDAEWETERATLAGLLAEPTGQHTDLGDAAVKTIGDLSSGQQLSELLIVSDGRRTGGAGNEEIVRAAKENEVQIDTVTLGTAEPLRNLAIAALEAPPDASLNDILSLRVSVVNHIQPDLKIKLRLYEKNQSDKEDQLVYEQEYTLPEGQKIISLTTIPKVEGEVRYTVKLPELPDELTYEDNKKEVFVNVVKRSMRVLFVSGAPTPEYQFIVPCLVRDPVMNVSCWLCSADVDYLQQGKVRLDRLPRTFEEWMTYDVVILYDIDPEKFGNEQENGLEHLIRKGGGLLFVSGRVHGLEALLQVRTAKMKEMLPVIVDKSQAPDYREILDKPFKAARTEAGKKHPVMQFEMGRQENDKVWDTFPEFFWHQPVARAKPEAVVLLKKEGGQVDARGDVLMAMARYGEGVVFFTGLDTMWRWRYPMENYDYDRFWNQTVRYLGETRLLGAQKQVLLNTDKKTYSPGETVRITLSVLDPGLLKQLQTEDLSVTITDESGAAYQTRLDPPTGSSPDYTASYKVRRVGSYKVRSSHALREGGSDQKMLFDETKHVSVDLQSLEQVDTTSDLEGMGRLASETNGSAYNHLNMDKLSELAARIPRKQPRITQQIELEIWDSPFFLLFFLGLATAEWVLRRRWNLL